MGMVMVDGGGDGLYIQGIGELGWFVDGCGCWNWVWECVGGIWGVAVLVFMVQEAVG